MTEGRVMPVEMGCVAVHDEELGARGVRRSGVRHGENALHVLMHVELVVDVVSGSARSEIGSVLILGVGIASLDHKPLEDAMETGAVIEALSRELLEVGHRRRSLLVPELHDHASLR